VQRAIALIHDNIPEAVLVAIRKELDLAGLQTSSAFLVFLCGE
jgi:hypothetical protein